MGQGNGPARPHVFIQANAKQSIGALVSKRTTCRDAEASASRGWPGAEHDDELDLCRRLQQGRAIPAT